MEVFAAQSFPIFFLEIHFLRATEQTPKPRPKFAGHLNFLQAVKKMNIVLQIEDVCFIIRLLDALAAMAVLI